VKQPYVDIETSDLLTSDGISRVAVSMSLFIDATVVAPVMAHCPKESRATLYERVFSGLVGQMCGEIGPEAAARVVHEVQIALASIESAGKVQH